MHYLQGLNPQQLEAVTHRDGPLLILAGAGSGKTRVITHRICHLMHAYRVPGHAILAVTFTNKAAEEMQTRVERLLSGTGTYQPPLVCTFHSFCVRLLRRDGRSLADIRPGFTPNFLIYDEDDQLAVVQAAYRQVGLDEKFMPYRTALSRISWAKNQKLAPEDLAGSARSPQERNLAAIYEAYEAELRRANALDFDDLLLEAVRLLRHDDQLRRRYNEQFQYLLIDEYQDTNRPQYELMRLLTEQHRNVCAVGDEDQSIYGWRGADIRNILDFEKDFPDARVIRLEQNYRSTRNILDAASAVVAHNKLRKGKWLWTDAEPGAPIGVYAGQDAEAEALFIADTIQQLLRDEPALRVAVLYRTNAQSRQIEEALRRYGLRYHVVGGLSFYQRAEIKDILAYLKLLVSPHDGVSLLRIINRPARGIGRVTVAQLEAHARQHNCSLWEALCRGLDDATFAGRVQAALARFRELIEELRAAAEKEPLGKLVKLVIEKTGYEDMLRAASTPETESRLENLDELVNAAVEAEARGESLAEFLDHAALVAESDQIDETAQVSLLTLHNAKGLEWPVVFLAGMEEGLFPHIRSMDTEQQLEEERRLCYVGMTRAQKRLYLTWARFRRRFGSGLPEPRIPSRFLSEVPQHLVEDLSPAQELAGLDAELFLDRHEVRQAVGQFGSVATTDPVENIRRFFESGKLVRASELEGAGRTPSQPSSPTPPPRTQRRVAPGEFPAGAVVEHPRFGRGTIVRREGEGPQMKLTILFPGHGLKKMVAQYAELRLVD